MRSSTKYKTSPAPKVMKGQTIVRQNTNGARQTWGLILNYSLIQHLLRVTKKANAMAQLVKPW